MRYYICTIILDDGFNEEKFIISIHDNDLVALRIQEIPEMEYVMAELKKKVYESEGKTLLPSGISTYGKFEYPFVKSINVQDSIVPN